MHERRCEALRQAQGNGYLDACISTTAEPDIHASHDPDRLPVLKLALRVYRRTGRALPLLARFAVMPFVLLLIVEGGFRHAAHIAETWVDVTILDSLMTVLGAAILTPLSVAAYRLFTFGREVVRADAVDDFPPGTVAVLALSVVFAVALLPFGDLLTLMEHETAMMPSIALAYHAFVAVGSLLAVLLAVRLVFLFNHAILGRDLNISLAWRQTGGNGWRMFGLLLLAQLPAAVLMLAVKELVLAPMGGEIDFGAWDAWAGLLGVVLCAMLVDILLVAAATFAYGHITGFPLAGGRGDPPPQPSLPFDAPL